MARTFYAACTTGWQAVVDGATYASVGIQLDGHYTAYLAVSAAQPTENSKDYMKLFMGGAREVVLDLDADEKLYIKGPRALDVAIRGYKKARGMSGFSLGFGVGLAASPALPVQPPSLPAPPAGFAYVKDSYSNQIYWQETVYSARAPLMTRIS